MLRDRSGGQREIEFTDPHRAGSLLERAQSLKARLDAALHAPTRSVAREREKERLMHVNLVHVKVKPEHVGAFIAATRPNHEGSVREPGNRRFDVLQDPGDPTRFLLYEVYASEADAAVHKQTAHYLAWRDAVAAMMAEPRRGVSWRCLFPEG